MPTRERVALSSGDRALSSTEGMPFAEHRKLSSEANAFTIGPGETFAGSRMGIRSPVMKSSGPIMGIRYPATVWIDAVTSIRSPRVDPTDTVQAVGSLRTVIAWDRIDVRSAVVTSIAGAIDPGSSRTSGRGPVVVF
jgi:hypothetical protein